MFCNHRFVVAFFLMVMASQMQFLSAQLAAFPTAEGAGKFVTGGRGSVSVAPRLYEVTTLGDDATAANTPGTFRYACTNNSPSTANRIIVFRVAGTIHLYAALSLNRANTTIAGQSAPGEGICVADYPVTIAANNIIIRYLHFRLGDKNQNLGMVDGSGNDDAFGDNGGGRQNIIIDHCTSSWSNDEALTIYKGDNVTVQWCMITEPLNFSYHFESGDANFEDHAFGGIWGGKHASFHHNLFAHCKGRMPRFDGIRNIPADTGDFRNNVLYNWSDYNNNGGEGGAYNVVNNYYKFGPNTPTSVTSGVSRRDMILNPYKTSSIPYGKFFLNGNYCDNSPDITNSNWKGAAFNGGTLADSATAKATAPFNTINVVTQTAQDAYNLVLANAGCSLPHRDTTDERIANDVRARTGRLIDVQGGFIHGTPYATSQVAWPNLALGFAPLDTDHDGMPDVWEEQRGLNKNSAADLNSYTATTGYNNIETYLNGDTIVAVGTPNTCIAAKQIKTAQTGQWLLANDSSYSHYNSPKYLISTDSVNVVAAILDNGNFGVFNVGYYATTTPRYDINNKPYLNRNITISPINSLLITTPISIRIYFTKAEFDALKLLDNTIATINDLRILKTDETNCIAALGANPQQMSITAMGTYGSYQNGYYLEFATTGFGSFFITSTIAANALPLQLLHFKAELNGDAVHTNWQTTNEVNTKNFMVESSLDGLLFGLIGTVEANNTAGIHNYFFNDVSPAIGTKYYRLKQVDRDGKFFYSSVVYISIRQKNKLAIFPNPVSNRLTIQHPKAFARAVIKIINVAGEEINFYNTATNASQSTITTAHLPAGMYTLVYQMKKIKYTTTFLKQ